jgi:hypothetical protein
MLAGYLPGRGPQRQHHLEASAKPGLLSSRLSLVRTHSVRSAHTRIHACTHVGEGVTLAHSPDPNALRVPGTQLELGYCPPLQPSYPQGESNVTELQRCRQSKGGSFATIFRGLALSIVSWRRVPRGHLPRGCSPGRPFRALSPPLALSAAICSEARLPRSARKPHANSSQVSYHAVSSCLLLVRTRTMPWLFSRVCSQKVLQAVVLKTVPFDWQTCIGLVQHRNPATKDSATVCSRGKQAQLWRWNGQLTDHFHQRS